MKKIVAILMSVVLFFGCVACSSQKSKIPDETFEVMGSFSRVEDGKFIVMFQNLGGIYEELYDKNGTVLKFINGDDEIYDTDGKKIQASELLCGNTLKISYDGKVYDGKNKTMKVYSVTKIA